MAWPGTTKSGTMPHACIVSGIAVDGAIYLTLGALGLVVLLSWSVHFTTLTW
jgi:hypothetical protein